MRTRKSAISLAFLMLIGACAPAAKKPGGAATAATGTANGGSTGGTTSTSAAGSGARASVDLGVGADFHGTPLFTADNPWNTNIASQPIDPNSAALIANCGSAATLHPDFGTEYNGVPNGIPYVVVAGTQAPVAVDFSGGYPDESDPGPYPIPPNAPVEGTSQNTDANGGDRHALVIDRDHWKLYETFSSYPVNGGASWKASGGAVFDLSASMVIAGSNLNGLRPADWTSADAAGLPIFPGLARYDEAVGQGAIKHALRVTCDKTQKGYVYPARHYASSITDTTYPPMGMRVRLQAGFDVAKFPASAQVILNALKQYGMIVADNGSAWYISGAPDARWSDDDLHTLTTVPTSALEVVTMGPVTTN